MVENIVLTSHELGYQIDTPVVDRGNIGNAAGIVSDALLLVERAKQARRQQSKTMLDLEYRRQAVLDELGRNSEQLDLNDDHIVSVFNRRLRRASSCRISEAEEIAWLSKHGDYSSPLAWLEVRNDKITLWKGYVFCLWRGKGDASELVGERYQSQVGDVHIEVYKSSRGAWIGIARSDYGNGEASVGLINNEDDLSKDDCIRIVACNAYNISCSGSLEPENISFIQKKIIE